MTPKEIAEKIEKGIAGIPRWRMFWDFKVGDLADFVADYKRQYELLEETRKAFQSINRTTSAGNRTLDEMIRDMGWANDIARSLLAKLDETQP